MLREIKEIKSIKNIIMNHVNKPAFFLEYESSEFDHPFLSYTFQKEQWVQIDIQVSFLSTH